MFITFFISCLLVNKMSNQILVICCLQKYIGCLVKFEILPGCVYIWIQRSDTFFDQDPMRRSRPPQPPDHKKPVIFKLLSLRSVFSSLVCYFG